MRFIGFMCATVCGSATAMSGQGLASRDSADAARVLIAYAVAHPMGVGSSHGAMTGLAIDSSASRWGALLSAALRQVAPALWLDAASGPARTQPHLRVRAVAPQGDSVIVETVWTWCFPNDGGESGWPVIYVLNHLATDWRVASASGSLVGHGRQCSFGRGGAR